MFYRQLEMGLAAAYELAGEDDGLQHDGPRTQEGDDAFIEKRAPRW